MPEHTHLKDGAKRTTVFDFQFSLMVARPLSCATIVTMGIILRVTVEKSRDAFSIYFYLYTCESCALVEVINLLLGEKFTSSPDDILKSE